MKRVACTLAALAVMAAASVGFVASVQAAAPGGGGGAGAGAAPGGPGGGGRGFGGGGAGGGLGRGAGGAGRGGGRGGRGGRGGFGGPAVPPGPPAPVPDVVAIPPSQSEVDQMNAELKKLVSSDNSPAKPLLQKYSSMVEVNKPSNPCIRPTAGGVRAPRHDAMVERAKQGGIDLLLEGDSITDWWINAGQEGSRTPTEAYTKYFGNIKTADFAVAGDTTQGVLWGLMNGEGTGFQPKAIMLMIGTNNMGGNSAAQIAEGVGAIVQEDRKDFPNAHILLLAIFPRGDIANPDQAAATTAMRAKIADCNKIISKLDGYEGHVTYMDIGDKFLDPTTKAFLPDAFRGDFLHPMEKGYEIWGAAVMPTLNGWLK